MQLPPLNSRTHHVPLADFRIYKCWRNMRWRCSNPDFPYYGAKGIRVCDEWQDYETFRDWARANGYTDELTIERIDSDGHYEPANCEWITASENARRAMQKRWTRRNLL